MKNLLLFSSLFLICAESSFAQGEAALPFLLISPAAISNGMGETSVALYRDNPFAMLSNPAHLGMFSRSNYFSAGYDYADWLPQFGQSDLTVKAFGFNAGVNLGQFGISPEMSVGLSYSRVRLNLGKFSVTSPDGPEVIATFDALETADNYSMGFGLHEWVCISAGFTVKQINSTLAPFNPQTQELMGPTRVSTYDVGILVQVPIIEILDRTREAPITFLAGYSPLLNLSVGLAKNNLSDKMVFYIDPDRSDPLPRTARVGVGVELGVSYTRDDLNWNPILFSWSRESNDLLVRRFPPPVDAGGVPIGDPPPPEYRGGLGDIKVFDDLILGKSNPDVIVKTGWQLTLYDLFSIRGGRFLESPDQGNRRFSTSGYTVRFGGFVRILRVLNVSLGTENLLGTIVNHIDLRYTHSKLDADEYLSPVNTTEFSSWNLLIFP